MKRQGKQHRTLRIITKATNTAADEVVSGQKHKHKGKRGKKPASKSRDKAKGAYKLKSGDVVLNHRLESWRVATGEDGRWSKGFNGEGYDDDDDDDREKEYGHGDALRGSVVVQEVERSVHGTNDEEERSAGEEEDFEGEGCDEDEDHEEQEYSHGYGLHESVIVQEMEEKCIHGTDDDDDDDEGDMGFYEVGFIWEDVDDEGWCVVDEM
ncbi:uncharacterized protein A4U43_C02F9550 [Asparagus officinalis]|uniref:Uncharacterized protein n=1 Tax=Asparagus officinalis TaxID=4686 RepID=A0A5P1FI00_ASPOF|nr:ribosome biogenesis protein ERB1-like [Asparagus officinalis]ONK77694.1 uncharacterized protein A4U43_C02F9550 [Asparagus officinalis]